MQLLDDALKEMDFEFFGNALHKTTPGELLGTPGAVFLDLRSKVEKQILSFEMPWIRCLHIPLHELPARWQEVPKDHPVGLFCSSDNRAAIAFAYLRGRGYSAVRIISGGSEGLVAELKPGKILKRLVAKD